MRETEDMDTMGACAACGSQMVRDKDWRAADDAQRAAWAEAGVRQHHGRMLCRSDYTLARKEGTLADFPASSVPRWLVLEDWQALASEREGMSQSAAVKLLAPRMGMTPEALERALCRANAAGVAA